MPVKKASKNYIDIQTKKRIREHLSNENDHISDEDIRNVKTDFVADERIDSSYQSEENDLKTRKTKHLKGENRKK